MDYRKFDMDLMGDDAMSWKLTEIEDHTPVLKANNIDKKWGNNGWRGSKKQQRHIARIPVYVMEFAKQQGYDMTQQVDIYKFLHDYPEYKTVQYIKSPNNGSAVSQGKVIIH